MPARSTIDDLPDDVRSAIHAAIERRVSIDDIVSLIRGMGADASRSAVGRYSQKFSELAKQQRDMRSVAEAFGREFGSADDHQGRMMTQLITSLVTRTLIPLATGEEELGAEEAPSLELARLAKAAKDAMAASKIDIEREAKIREEEARRTREKAADDADAVVRATGASEETLRTVRMRILGLSS